MKMQCKSCNTELPKHAKVCPRCGALVGKKSGNHQATSR
ncbi:zinc-ribbon domain-containing protein [Lachnospira hominis (ex Liu et al. 2021)]|uniref:Zinc-ribbon domain-containing protein n=1 Tax=Lachnospira hominis (ex Liu et al. 2021) TaxID=2763051 RepID=A0ABR7FW59_9FIRM|nr:zinc-ribbon domain-containing protein [Lachnospira hominis]MBC5679433.1 zinc-ribbon domain-containing protein [Lachnospira hominis]